MVVVATALLALSLVSWGGPELQAQGQTAATPSTTGGLAEAINAFRQQNGLPAIPVSPELTKVAQAHVHDLLTFHPDQVPGCNMHSWSPNGPWKTSGCFTGAFTDAENHIMWDKPREIANYPGNGYENMAFATPNITAAQAVALWTVPGDPHRDVILNQGIWKDVTWKAVGGWVEGGYASAWFGEVPDPTAGTAGAVPPAAGSQATTVGAAPLTTATVVAAPVTTAAAPAAGGQPTNGGTAPPIATAPPMGTAPAMGTEAVNTASMDSPSGPDQTPSS